MDQDDFDDRATCLMTGPPAEQAAPRDGLRLIEGMQNLLN